jgi:NADPH-dependent 2,4-dienoyl-CoA reductase/sulfur reductase-like enzyme
MIARGMRPLRAAGMLWLMPAGASSLANYDVALLGGGVAALTAAIFAARHGRSTLVLMSDIPGGHLTNTEKIEDFPGFPEGVPGYLLCPTMQEQATNEGAEFRLAGAQRMERSGSEWLVITTDGDVRARRHRRHRLAAAQAGRAGRGPAGGPRHQPLRQLRWPAAARWRGGGSRRRRLSLPGGAHHCWLRF